MNKHISLENLQKYDAKIKENILSTIEKAKKVEFYQEYSFLPLEGNEDILYVIKSDEKNFQDPSIYIYVNNKYKKISGAAAQGGSGGFKTSQVTKLNVTAPKNIEIDIDETDSFNLPEVSVLKYSPGSKNVIHTACEFNNADKSDFEENDFVIFDGAMKLKTVFEKPFEKQDDLFIISIDKSNINIKEMEVI